MRRWFHAAGFLAAAWAASAGATPARVNALDAGTFLVPDDWDIINYYSLAPEFANHLYFYYPLSHQPYGWGNFEVKPLGTFIVWINLPNPTAPIFGAVSKLSALGFKNLDLDAPGGQDWDPRETRIGTPDLKLGLGWGRRFGDALSVGMCTRLATLDESDTEAETGGAVGLLANPGSLLGVAVTSATVTSFETHQRSSTFALGPSLSWKGESFTVDAYAAWIVLGVDNTWKASLLKDATFDSADLSRSLEFDGSGSYQARLKVMVPLSDQSTLAVSGQWTSLDLSTKHTVKESYAGAGLTAAQKAGVDHVDGTETLTAAPWTSMAGVFTRAHEYLLVVGIGANGAAQESLDVAKARRATATDLNDLVVSNRTDTKVESFDVPFLMGAEYSMFSWLRLRAVAQRNLIGSVRVTSRSSEDTDFDGAVDQSSSSVSETHGTRDWLFRLGFGLVTDRIGWDVLVNLQPSDLDYASPFFTAPTKATWKNPSITTAVVYKW